jgi:diguanylate cyclase (GGDEF) domain
MHYSGMAAMRMSPPIDYDPLLVSISVIIAILASLTALLLAFLLRQSNSTMIVLAKVGSAAVMGFAITGMHYTGMAAARYAPNSVCLAAGPAGGMDILTLAQIVTGVVSIILIMTMILSALDAHFAAANAKLASSLQSANEQLLNLALYDRLTGLPGRLLLEDRLLQAVNRADRHNNPFACMVIDLDKFKPVNDTFGHLMGDELLKIVAERLSNCVRKEDTAARTGGDEFIVLLSGLELEQNATVVANKILDELSRPFHVMGQELNISCSIGISMYPRDGKDSITLINNADKAMYHSKRAGRKNYSFFTSGMATETPEPQQA